MQQTETYKLNLIETSDTFSPDALNENMETLDAAVPRIATGSYEGTGSYQTIELGFKPRAVLVFRRDGVTVYNNYPCSGLALSDSPLTDGSSYHAVEIRDNGFRVLSKNIYAYANQIGYTYNYIAFG